MALKFNLGPFQSIRKFLSLKIKLYWTVNLIGGQDGRGGFSVMLERLGYKMIHGMVNQHQEYGEAVGDSLTNMTFGGDETQFITI